MFDFGVVFQGRTREEEKVRIGVSIVLNLGFMLYAVQRGEVAVGAGCEALDSPFAVLRNLIVDRVVPQHSYRSHRANRQE